MSKQQVRAYLQSLIEAYENSTFYENPSQPTYRYIPVSENDVKALRLAMALIGAKNDCYAYVREDNK